MDQSNRVNDIENQLDNSNSNKESKKTKKVKLDKKNEQVDKKNEQVNKVNKENKKTGEHQNLNKDYISRDPNKDHAWDNIYDDNIESDTRTNNDSSNYKVQSINSMENGTINIRNADNTNYDCIEMCNCEGHLKGKQKHWTPRISNKLRDYTVKSAASAWQTGTDAAKFNSLNSKLNLWIGILSVINIIGILGAQVFVQYVDELWADILYYVFAISSLLLSLTVGILQVIQMKKGLVDKIVRYSVSSVRYAKLSRLINNQMDLPLHKRAEAIQLLNEAERTFSDLEIDKPFISGETENEWNEYYASYKNNPAKYNNFITLPDELNNIADAGHKAEAALRSNRNYNLRVGTGTTDSEIKPNKIKDIVSSKKRKKREFKNYMESFI